MKTVIIALPVDDDTDIFDVQAVVAQAFPTGGDDRRDCCVYESAQALADDLGLVPDEEVITL